VQCVKWTKAVVNCGMASPPLAAAAIAGGGSGSLPVKRRWGWRGAARLLLSGVGASLVGAQSGEVVAGRGLRLSFRG
jgi:hypothetical protein